jgi:hypothetical protein
LGAAFGFDLVLGLAFDFGAGFAYGETGGVGIRPDGFGGFVG